jgi:peptide deformylase
MILNLVPGNSPILLQQSEKVKFPTTEIDIIQLAKDLYETLMSTKYIGLSAPQVGIPLRVFALRAQPGIVCVNPIVVDRSVEEEVLDEMCMTYGGLILPIKRPSTIKVRYTEPNGNVVTCVFAGMTARYFLHELDHLNGKVYTQIANKMHLERAVRRKKQLDRQVRQVRRKLKDIK